MIYGVLIKCLNLNLVVANIILLMLKLVLWWFNFQTVFILNKRLFFLSSYLTYIVFKFFFLYLFTYFFRFKQVLMVLLSRQNDSKFFVVCSITPHIVLVLFEYLRSSVNFKKTFEPFHVTIVFSIVNLSKSRLNQSWLNRWWGKTRILIGIICFWNISRKKPRLGWNQWNIPFYKVCLWVQRKSLAQVIIFFLLFLG